MNRHSRFLITITGTIILSGCFCIAVAGTRYRDVIFPSVTTGMSIPFGLNTGISGTPDTLLMDVYQPAGDTVTLRPLVIGIHGGSLVNGFVRDADDLVLPEAVKPGLLVDGEILLRVVQRQLDGNLLAESNRLAGRLVLVDGQILTLSCAELDLGVLKEVIADLGEVSFCQDRGEVKIPGDA